MGSHVQPKALRALQLFIDDYNLPFGLVINQSPSADYIIDKIIQIPVGWVKNLKAMRYASSPSPLLRLQRG